jgi:hypothetical protein
VSSSGITPRLVGCDEDVDKNVGQHTNVTSLDVTYLIFIIPSPSTVRCLVCSGLNQFPGVVLRRSRNELLTGDASNDSVSCVGGLVYPDSGHVLEGFFLLLLAVPDTQNVPRKTGPTHSLSTDLHI